MLLPPEGDWLPALNRWHGAPVTVVDQRPLQGGYASAGVVGIVVAAGGQRVSVVLKRCSAGEVSAMRALAVVVGVARPYLIAAGQDEDGHWLLTPRYDGSPLGSDAPMPAEVWEMLARVHSHWLRRRHRGLPVVNAAWWETLCRARIVPAVMAAAWQGSDAAFDVAAESLQRWAEDPRMIEALARLPKTLVHGDPHRGNILLDPSGATIIDWGNAKVAPPGLDLAVMRAQGASISEEYLARTAGGHADSDPGLVEVERAWADVHVHVAYLGFAADHLGAALTGRVAACRTTTLRF